MESPEAVITDCYRRETAQQEAFSLWARLTNAVILCWCLDTSQVHLLWVGFIVPYLEHVSSLGQSVYAGLIAHDLR
jgi:hypothetical protein